MRFIGLDVHLDFCEVAICEAGRVRSGGRVPTSPQGLAILANSLGPDDHVALEATGNALAIARAAGAARGAGRRGDPDGAAGDHRGEGQDRPPRRAHAGAAARRRAAARLLAAG